MKKSINGKIWQQKHINENYVLQLQQKLGISDFLAKILSLRVNNIDSAQLFLSAKIKHLLPDPFHLLDMQKAVERTVRAILHQQPICIFADYDVDGATSSALLKSVFRELRVDADIYVPDRLIEGYGPTVESIRLIKEQGIQLLITVDCGAVAHEALEYASQQGLDVIVIDHHICADLLPQAIAIINPNRLDETSSCKHLAAVGVAFLFVVALVGDLKKRDYFNSSLPPNLMKYLDLVALGTVCDVMPITELNRAFVAQGLKVMAARQNVGIKALFDIAGLDSRPGCYHLGFVLGPRINAGGRVGKANLGSKLLSTVCEIEAGKIAQELEQHNNERKVIEMLILDEATEIAQTQKDSPCLFIVGNNWHPGVIGIIAGRLKEKYDKPVAVIALDKEGLGKASCRSIKNIDFGSKVAIAKQKNLIISGGGHAMAAGFTVAKEQLAELQKFFTDSFSSAMEERSSCRICEYDAQLTTHSLNQELMQELEALEPFGNSNQEPLFKISHLYVLKAEIVGQKHIKCMLAPTKEKYGYKVINAVAFNAVNSPLQEILLSQQSHSISVIGSLSNNIWRDIIKIQMQIYDLIIEDI